MPELPEVEMVKQGLEQLIVGQKIQSVETNRPQMFSEGYDEFTTGVQNKTIEAIERYGKYLLFILNQGVMISHLRMEGKYIFSDQPNDDQHIHVTFHLTSGNLYYRDVRTFGRFSYAETKDDVIAHLPKGVDPTLATLDVEVMQQQLSRYKSPIKTVLLNQKVIAGLGNIYVDEVLFKSHISPFRQANTLTSKEIEQIIEQTTLIFKQAIACGGTTIRTYQNAFGEAGHFQEYLTVYGKEGEPCIECGTLIQKEKLQGRGTHFCPRCQR